MKTYNDLSCFFCVVYIYIYTLQININVIVIDSRCDEIRLIYTYFNAEKFEK